MTIKPVLVPDHTANDLRRLMDHFAEASTGPTCQQLAESRAAVAAAEGVTEGTGQQLNIQQLATISDQALDNAYHYGRSTPGNTFGWQANLKSAAYAKQMIDQGVTDIEAISDAIHKGWNVTARAFVQNPDQFDDTEKLRAAGKLESKLQQRAKLMNIGYAQLSDEEQEKDRVVARALLQALNGPQGVAEGTESEQEELAKKIRELLAAGKDREANHLRHKLNNLRDRKRDKHDRQQGVAEGSNNDQKAKTKIIEMMKDALDKEARIGRGDDKSSKIYILAKERFGKDFADDAYEYGALHVRMLVEPSDEDELAERNAEMQALAHKMGYKHDDYMSEGTEKEYHVINHRGTPTVVSPSGKMNKNFSSTYDAQQFAKKKNAELGQKKSVTEGIMDTVKQAFNDCVVGYPQGTSEGQFIQGWARAIRAETGRDIPLEKLTKLYQDYAERSDELMQSHGTTNEDSGVTEGEGMSRAAKGYEKYGRAGMAALARAGREGRALDPVRQKYDRYDEAAESDVAEGSDDSGAYDKWDPKHPDFVKNYRKFQASNPGATLKDFIADLKKGIAESIDPIEQLRADIKRFAQ